MSGFVFVGCVFSFLVSAAFPDSEKGVMTVCCLVVNSSGIFLGLVNGCFRYWELTLSDEDGLEENMKGQQEERMQGVTLFNFLGMLTDSEEWLQPVVSCKASDDAGAWIWIRAGIVKINSYSTIFHDSVTSWFSGNVCRFGG